MKINTAPLSGFLELLPDEQTEFDRIKNIIQETYASFGFTPLDTPAVERSQVLMAKGSEETDKQIYFVNNTRGGNQEGKVNELALRFDLTVPLARYVANNSHNLVFPFRRQHIAKVYRGERAQKGRFREFYQCDIDIIGQNSLSTSYDAEMPSIIYKIFKKLQIGKFKIKISNRKIFGGVFESFGITQDTSYVLRIIDKAEKITPEKFIQEFEELGLSTEQIKNLQNFISIKGSVKEVLESLENLDVTSQTFQEGLSELKEVTDMLILLDVDPDYFEIDLAIVRGLDYYTGTVYETVMEDSRIGSVCSGGRYDNLASSYTDLKLPGVGISIGLSRLFFQLREHGLLSNLKNGVSDVIVMPNDNTNISTAIKAANQMREKGINVDILFQEMPIKKKFAYIDKQNTPYTIVVKTEKNGNEVLSFQYKQEKNIIKEVLDIQDIISKIKL